MSPARTRIEHYAALAPAGSKVTITEEPTAGGLDIAQLVVKGSIDTILVTVSSRAGSKRTRCGASQWFNGGSKFRPVPVGWIGFRIRNLYI